MQPAEISMPERFTWITHGGYISCYPDTAKTTRAGAPNINAAASGGDGEI
jgi:hypothetical protein